MTTPDPLIAELRRLRETSGISQEALAARIGVARYTVIRWENGRKEPTAIYLRSYAQALGADLILVPPAATTDRVRIRRAFEGDRAAIAQLNRDELMTVVAKLVAHGAGVSAVSRHLHVSGASASNLITEARGTRQAVAA